MSQKSSDPQAISFVSQPLKRDNKGCDRDRSGCDDVKLHGCGPSALLAEGAEVCL